MDAWAALVGACAPIFTQPSYGIFTDLATGWVLSRGRLTITAMINLADPVGRPGS